MLAEYPWNITMRYCQYIWKKIPYEIPGIFRYYEIRPVSNQPARFFVTTKTHKFNSLEEINVDQLKLCPIIDQTGHTTKPGTPKHRTAEHGTPSEQRNTPDQWWNN